jgi:hypothetical protein
VADLGTMTTTPPERDGTDGDSRAVRRARPLPGGRAVVGALLVAAAAVGVFAAYLTATAEPATRYLVARETVEPGTRLESISAVAELFESRPIELEADLARRAVRLEDAQSLLGRLVIVPLEPGQLLARSGLVADGGIADAHKLSFAVDPSAALAGELRVGERLDVLATYGSGEGAYTAYIVRGVPLVALRGDAGTSGLGAGSGGGPLTLTVAVTSPEDVQALAHAVAAADIVVTRSTVVEGDQRPAPAPYVASPERGGPAPDPAGDPVGAPGTASESSGGNEGQDEGPSPPEVEPDDVADGRGAVGSEG